MLSMDEIEYQHKALSLNPVCCSSSLHQAGFFIVVKSWVKIKMALIL